MSGNGKQSPSHADGNGRNGNGTFTAGNKYGKGNPNLKAVRRFRQVMLDAITDEDFQAVTLKLVKEARAGQPWAVKEFFDRLLGKPKVTMEVQEAPHKTDPFDLLRDLEVTGAVDRALARRQASPAVAEPGGSSN